jgi:hypothetical protein
VSKDLKRTIELAMNSNKRMLKALEEKEEKRDDVWLNFLIREAWINFKRAFSIWYSITFKFPGGNVKFSLKDFLKELQKII